MGKKVAKSLGAKGLTAEEKRERLMKRLSLTTEQRRKEKVGLGKGVSKALEGHKLKKKEFKMSEEFGGDKPKCETCGSRDSCEEDVDNAGIWYCAKCWEEYEGSEEETDKKEPGKVRRSLKELKNKPKVVVEDLPRSPESKVEANKSMKSPPPPPAAAAGKAMGEEEEEEEEESFEEGSTGNLWVIHDNPLLKTAIGGRKMKCMLETKDPDNLSTGVIVVIGGEGRREGRREGGREGGREERSDDRILPQHITNNVPHSSQRSRPPSQSTTTRGEPRALSCAP